MSSRRTRREFLGTTGAAAATTWAGAGLYAADASVRPRVAPPPRGVAKPI